jgi:hypothetical protein
MLPKVQTGSDQYPGERSSFEINPPDEDPADAPIASHRLQHGSLRESLIECLFSARYDPWRASPSSATTCLVATKDTILAKDLIGSTDSPQNYSRRKARWRAARLRCVLSGRRTLFFTCCFFHKLLQVLANPIVVKVQLRQDTIDLLYLAALRADVL